MRPLKMQRWQLFTVHLMCNDKFDFFCILDERVAFQVLRHISTFFPNLMAQNRDRMVNITDPSFLIFFTSSILK